MTDIAAYAAKILADADRPLFQEAAASALHGAPRGAYILIWIACAEGLKRKFRVAAVRDGKANKMLGKIIDAEEQQRSADMLILTKAKDYGFINDVAFQKLEYVYKMRCIYGHPYEAAPDDEELTNAAVVVVNEVLGKPTLLRHGFVQTLIEKLVSDVHYLEQTEASVRSFTRDISVRIDPAVYGYVMDTYAKRLEPDYDDASLEIVVERGLWFLSEFLLTVETTFYSASQWHEFVATYPKTMQHVILSSGYLFAAVGERARDYAVSYIITHAETRPSRLKEVEKLLDDGLLSNEQQRRLQNLEIRVLKAANLKISTCYDTVLSALKSHNWYRQNPAIDLIAANGKGEIARLTPEQQEELGRNILQVADGGSSSASSYLSALSRDQGGLEQPFLKGLIFEAFVNERSEFRLKEEYMATILDLLTTRHAIETELVQAIDASRPKGWIPKKAYQRTHDMVKERPDLLLLAEALERNYDRLTVIDDF